MIRFFGKNQVLFYSIREPQQNQEKILKQLKAVGDDTRFKIIALLNEKEPLRGLDIAKELSMAPSTISHHMEQLKSCGLLNEEQDKSSKYYSINRNSAKELLEAMEKLLYKLN
jgi:DNA-binding transcriptional ArsR family regulator